MVNPINVPDDAKAERMAEKRTERLREREGIFAACVEPVTGEQIKESARRHRERFQATMDKLQARGEEFKARVATIVSPEELAALAERRATLPDGPEYHADYWSRALGRIANVCWLDQVV